MGLARDPNGISLIRQKVNEKVNEESMKKSMKRALAFSTFPSINL